MPYAFVQDVPANPDLYRQILAELGDDPPAGLVSHVAISRPGGLRYVDVWETEAAWARFRDERLEPVVSAVLARHGIPHDHGQVTHQEVEVVHAWLGG